MGGTLIKHCTMAMKVGSATTSDCLLALLAMLGVRLGPLLEEGIVLVT